MKFLKNLEIEDLVLICDNYCSASEYLRLNALPTNGRYIKVLTDKVREFDLIWKLPASILDSTCPVCNSNYKKSRQTQVTCSKSCANTYFRSGGNHPNYVHGKSSYRQRSLEHYGHKCLACDETLVIEIYHIDENRLNNSIDNIIPLCPTHHKYMHTEYKDLILDKIISGISSAR